MENINKNIFIKIGKRLQNNEYVMLNNDKINNINNNYINKLINEIDDIKSELSIEYNKYESIKKIEKNNIKKSFFLTKFELEKSKQLKILKEHIFNEIKILETNLEKKLTIKNNIGSL